MFQDEKTFWLITSRIHDARHLFAFLDHLQRYVPYPVTLVPAMDHMSLHCFYYLLGKSYMSS